jgi:ABC-type sugar transport system permease subunit
MSALASTATAPPRSWWRRTQNARTAYLFLLPALLVMLVITFYPLVFQVWMSFTNYGLQNLRLQGRAAFEFCSGGCHGTNLGRGHRNGGQMRSPPPRR